jgi:outer membrane protein OmpA-like peptidoglycan-associated protein
MKSAERMEAMMTWKRSTFLCAALLTACGSSPPPRELLDARAAYNQAKSGKAPTFVPAELHTARVALNAAEQAYEDDAESPDTYALSYVALRTAQLVEAKANTKSAEADLARAETDYEKLQEDEVTRTRGELARTKQELAMQGEQLTAERKAREEAMRKLAEAAALNVKEEPRGTVIVLPGDVLFESGKSKLTVAAQQKLTLIAGTLAPQAEQHNLVIEGHTDSRGSRDLNMQLSLERAQASMNYLVSRGVPAEAVTAVGIGPDRPIADNNTREGRQENRRVEIIVKPAEKR